MRKGIIPMYDGRPFDTAVTFDPPYGEPDRDGRQGFELLPDGAGEPEGT